MRKLISYLFILSAFVLFQNNAHAIGDAGCGLGSMIFKENKIVSQVLASTTNNLTYTQFFGITTGTSNCSRNGFAMNDKEQIFYAESNLPRLSIEMAQGEGESLDAFAVVLGCEKSSITEFKRLTKEKYPTFFPSEKTTAVDMLHSLKQEMQRDFVLSNSCTQIS